MINTLGVLYQEKLKTDLAKELNLANLFSVPKLMKVTVNVGSAQFKTDKEDIEKAKSWMSLITGQSAKITKARMSIAGFNVREGDTVGMQVTLRGERMYDFVQKLFNIVLPQIKDFQGVPLKGFDGHGNYTLGLSEQIIFPEVDYDKIGKISGLSICFTTSAKDTKEAEALLTALGMPFAKLDDKS